MRVDRRGLFGLFAGALATPTAFMTKPKVKLNPLMLPGRIVYFKKPERVLAAEARAAEEAQRIEGMSQIIAQDFIYGPRPYSFAGFASYEGPCIPCKGPFIARINEVI